MAVSKPCPKCGAFKLHRSRSKNALEKVLKILLPIRPFRCSQCQWRGWLSKRAAGGGKVLLRNIGFYILIVVVSFLIAHIIFGSSIH